MNRHARITERIDKRNDKLHFIDGTTNATKTIIKEYQLIYESLLYRRAKGMSAGIEIIEKITKLQNKMMKNEQVRHLVNTISFSTYDDGFCIVFNTPLSQFLDETKHIPRF